MPELHDSPGPEGSSNRFSVRKLLTSILITGLIAGVLDILAAFAYVHFGMHKGPVLVLKFISSGLFGIIHALSGGQKMAIYGLLIHFAIAYFWTVFFFLAYSLILKKYSIWINSCVIGLVIWLVMNLLALPLSRVPHSSLTISGVVGGIVVLIIAVGIPISVGAKRVFNR